MVIATCLLAVTFVALACDSGDDNGGPKVPDLQIHLTPGPAAMHAPHPGSMNSAPMRSNRSR
ncbi:MAG: hypothetical protein IIB88_11085 [Chloroflexi bacterium]|nr:hypothetical protein [Chloroflexota bacterium]